MHDHRDELFIPVPRTELVELLCADRTLSPDERDGFRALCERLAALFHLDYNRRLQKLKTAYAPFDPDSDSTPLGHLTADERQKHLNQLYSDFAWLLERANFKHLSREEIEPALDGASDWGIRMDVDFGAFEHVALFVRGDTFQKRTRRRWRNLWRLEETEVPIYRRLVLILKLRPHKRLTGEVDTRNVYLKVFKDIPKLDVLMLLPGARVRLSPFDRGRIGFPLVSGIALSAWNILTDLAHRLEEVFLAPNVMWGLALGGIGYGYRSYYGYRQLRQRYHLTLTQSLYFQNLDSNAGVLTRLLDEAEEQECRLAVLAYYCLWRYGGGGWTAEDLDATMELYLDRYAELVVNCGCGEGLALLRKLHLVEEAGGRCRALPLPRALDQLQLAWNAHLPNPLAPCG
jgi:hypothetical protein